MQMRQWIDPAEVCALAGRCSAGLAAEERREVVDVDPDERPHVLRFRIGQMKDFILPTLPATGLVVSEAPNALAELHQIQLALPKESLGVLCTAREAARREIEPP